VVDKLEKVSMVCYYEMLGITGLQDVVDAKT